MSANTLSPGSVHYQILNVVPNELIGQPPQYQVVGMTATLREAFAVASHLPHALISCVVVLDEIKSIVNGSAVDLAKLNG